ncbi:penicillin binding protein transpeptidase domain-containing protein [Leptospira kmetyi]|uniref:Penicillin binding protein transpeptidase domain-containing protein n=1 Tax=Leptospira kmetyi TaxID=408139 RepID=A0AAD0ULK6_9LEPT|nr:penicillin-binding transpeptidase domain-containing protein [Leptospira kmetyi]AYV54726.1 penicillin binding protein transpeptidase domain-containing protein [Leptospira kmetyi]
MKNSFLSLVLILVWIFSCKSDPVIPSLPPMPFSEKNLNGEGKFLCAILINQTARNKIYFQKDECFYKTPPSSLFHPYLALVALESGYLKEDQSLFFWDKTRHPYIRWQKDQNLKSALEYSVHWYFTKLWNDIGPEKGKPLLEKTGAFSNPVPSTRNSFWLDGSYNVSPSEFADLLIRLQEPAPPFRNKTISTVFNLLKRTPGSLSNASGSHDLTGDWNGVEDYKSDSAFHYTQDEANSWFWTSFQKSNVQWILLTRVRVVGQPSTPLEAAKLASKVLQEESIVP